MMNKKTLLLAQQKMIADSRDFRREKLPSDALCIGNDGKFFVYKNGSLELFLFFRDLWHRKLRINYPRNARVELQNNSLHFFYSGREDVFTLEKDSVSNETYFLRRCIFRNKSGKSKICRTSMKITYFTEGPLADFAYASSKWICRGDNLEEYPYPDFAGVHLSEKANNQLFYNYSGGTYIGSAWLDVGKKWLSEPGRDSFFRLTHEFRSTEPEKLESGSMLERRFAIFAGVGKEESIGMLSDILWRLNREPMHLPQTDMRTFLKNYVSVWHRAELDGERPGDHYAAHFFVGFYGQFPDGYYPPDQFGCSWLSYDLLKADYFCRLYDRTGEKEYLDKAGKIVFFYCRNHFIGKSSLNWSFHTGGFMKACPPYCEKSGWGAPLDAGYFDSLAQSEMIYDALMIYRRHPEFFPEKYAEKTAEDVLKLQQADGHFRRRYNVRLEAEAKPGWIDQNYESQSWIPSLLLLSETGGGERCRKAAILCGEAALRDLEIKGMFAMGGCETDYPTLWDIDGYRSMLRAMLALYDATGEKRWLAGAEKVQSFSNAMMTGYNVEIPEGTFYRRINWHCKGMIATSFYNRPDYLRSFSTPTGNQSVCWVGYLLLRLYRATGKRIYADRGVAAVRQVMVYRDEESLKGKPYLKNLLYTIFENNPQMSDPGGNYEAGVAQDGCSMFIDLYVYLDDILEEFGDVYCDLERKELIGINCFQCKNVDFEKRQAEIINEFDFDRPFVIRRSDGKTISGHIPADGTMKVNWSVK